MLNYLGPGIGIGSIISFLAVVLALLFVLHAFVVLPLKRWLKKHRKTKK